jgi:DNA-binding protein H-NS
VTCSVSSPSRPAFYEFFISRALLNKINKCRSINSQKVRSNMNVSSADLKSMSVDKLSALRAQVDVILSSKVAEERRSVQEQLHRLDRLMGTSLPAKGAGRGVRGPVAPKYRNPEDPNQTWAGRGLKPRWLAAALKRGKKLDDFTIVAPAKKTRGRPKKS